MLTTSQKAIKILNILRSYVREQRAKSIQAHADYARELEGYNRAKKQDDNEGNMGPCSYTDNYHPEKELKRAKEADKILGEADEMEQFAIETFLVMIDKEIVAESTYIPYARIK